MTYYKMEHIKEIYAENVVANMLNLIGEDHQRPGLVDTPKRVVKMWKEIFRGYNPEDKPTVTTFKNGEDGLHYDQMIIDTGKFYSHCEHHMVPFFGRYWFGYIPSDEGKVLGLSKVARLVDYHSARLQVQERLVQDIINDLWNTLSAGAPDPIGMGLIMKGEHLCKTMRGAKKEGQMTTIKLMGNFKEQQLKTEFLNLINHD
jgi:GTP cyclohydrolase I